MRSRRPQWLPVVAGLIQREGQVLVGLRPHDETSPGLWEFPGGKIEMGEHPEIALRRELNEELSIEAQIGPLALAVTHQYEALNILLLFYHVHFWKGEVKPIHHTELRWLAPGKVGELALLEANQKCLPRILSAIDQHGSHTRLP